jgi:tetratricopeptide (TPR) repeat protein
MPRQKSTHVDSPAAVGRRLKEARERVGLSQRALSFPGCSPAYISRIEAGERIPSLQLLRKLGRQLGVSEDYLATGAELDSFEASILLDAELALRLDETDRARELYERALDEAVTDAERAEALEGLGKVDVRLGRLEAAVEKLERALALCPDPCDRPSLVETLGRTYGALGELAPAIALFEQCVERYERDADPVRYVRFACLLGYALSDSGNFAEAERIVARALLAGRGVQDPYTRARLYWSQSRVLLEQGQSGKAERYARQALDTLRTTEDSHALAQAHQLLAGIYLDLGRADEAASLLQEGWPLIATTATPVELAHYRIEEARALAALGQSEQAASLAMALTQELGTAEPLEGGRAYVLLGDVFAELGDRARAKELFELGVDLLEQRGPTRYLVEAYKKLAQLLEAEGRPDEALETLKRALGVQERAGKPLT